MITCHNIGLMGLLGNQMFQIAATISISKYLGVPYCIPDRSPYGNELQRMYLHECFNIHDWNIKNIDISAYTSYIEPHFHFDAEFYNIKDNTNIEGYFQSEKYFLPIKNELNHIFQFKSDILEKSTYIINQFKNRPTISLHVRRGDYLGYLERFHILDMSYYECAIRKYFSDKNYNILIFSDDIEWCNANFNFENVYFSDNNNYVDLCLMTLCDHCIISNSTFSWWGAYLNNNKNKRIICSDKWFSDNNFDTKDIYPTDWIVI